MDVGLLDGWPLGSGFRFAAGRKVRSPKGSMPANGRGGSLKASFTESATENIPPVARAFEPVLGVRVKRCGKSAPRQEQSVPAG
jgi:hypothetical protein